MARQAALHRPARPGAGRPAGPQAGDGRLTPPSPGVLRWASRAGLAALALAAIAALCLAPDAKTEALELLRAHAVASRAFSHAHPLAAISMFVAAYALAVTAFLPVALVMTAASGFLFGGVAGALISALGATLGAAIGYGLARGALGEAVQRAGAAGGRVQSLLAGMKRDTFRYVLSLRLLPLTPFTLVSIAAGAVRAPLKLFLLATALGILPESAIYAWVGRGLSQVLMRGGPLHASDLLRPGVLWPLVGLAALALASLIPRRRRL